MSFSNYKTTIDGTTVSLDDLFHCISGSTLRVNGEEIKTKFSITNVPVGKEDTYDRSKPALSGMAEGLVSQKKCGYKIGGEDIGPSCCGKYYDKTSSQGWTDVDDWVNYYIVIVVGKGGKEGHGRNSDDADSKASGNSGSSGGFAVWKSPENLGKTRNSGARWQFQIDVGDNAKFTINKLSGGQPSYIQGNIGNQGNQVTGKSDEDANEKEEHMGGKYAGNVSSNGGTLLHEFTGADHKEGRAHFRGGYGTPRYSHNQVPAAVYAWNPYGYGRGSHWTDDNLNNPPGLACCRYYPIAYNEHTDA